MSPAPELPASSSCLANGSSDTGKGPKKLRKVSRSSMNFVAPSWGAGHRFPRFALAVECVASRES